MRLLAIDPGPEQSAYVLWDGARIERHGKVANADVLQLFRDGLCITHAVCERIRSYGMPAGAELFETCEWAGRFWEAAEARLIPWVWLPRIEVKKYLCHDSRAKDANIRRALLDRFGQPGTKKQPGMLYGIAGDVWAALAVAVTWWDQNVRTS